MNIKNLIYIRKVKRLTIRRLCQLTGISQPTINKIESGKSHNINHLAVYEKAVSEFEVIDSRKKNTTKASK